MDDDELYESIKEKILEDERIREEFESFVRCWVGKHELPHEMYRSLMILMSGYVSERRSFIS